MSGDDDLDCVISCWRVWRRQGMCCGCGAPFELGSKAPDWRSLLWEKKFQASVHSTILFMSIFALFAALICSSWSRRKITLLELEQDLIILTE